MIAVEGLIPGGESVTEVSKVLRVAIGGRTEFGRCATDQLSHCNPPSLCDLPRLSEKANDG